MTLSVAGMHVLHRSWDFNVASRCRPFFLPESRCVCQAAGSVQGLIGYLSALPVGSQTEVNVVFSPGTLDGVKVNWR